jgi:thymidine kinase
MEDLYLEFDCIAIDEGQFFSDLVEFSEKAAQAGKVVMISSLSGTFFREPWKSISELIPLCESVTKLSAICKLCKRKAHFTYRTAKENCKTLIGGAEMYMPLCRDCHNRESALHKQIYEGDATVINVRLEDEVNSSKLTLDDSKTKLRKEESLAS